jgi:di- and tripeptidase
MLTFRRDQHKLFAHHGYVYCMLLVRGVLESRPGAEALLTGSGDGSVKIWDLGNGEDEPPMDIVELKNGAESVLSIAVDGPFLYCGLAGGAVKVWNMDSRQVIKKIATQGDVWAVGIINGITICGDSSGVVKVSGPTPGTPFLSRV